MARPRKFNEEAILEAVTQVFWNKGYAGTSMHDLVQATGLRPGSLYAAFYNKQNLFKLSLENYTKTLESELAQFFEAEQPACEKINRFFNMLVEFCETTPQGCFLVNTLFAANLEDKEILEQVKSIFLRIEARFASLFTDAQKQNILNPNITPELAAKIVISAIYGFRGYSKLSGDSKDINMLKKQTLNLLFKEPHND